MQRKTKMCLGVLSGVMVLIGTVVVRAQNRDAHNPYRAAVKARFEALDKQLNLSAAQKKSIAELVRAAMPQGRVIISNDKLSNEQKQQQIKALRDSTRSKMAQVLTADQRQKAQKLFESRRERIGTVLNDVADELQMTDKQRAEARPIIEDAIKQGRAIFYEASGFSQKRAKLMQLRATTHEKLASILTPEQMQKLHQMRDAVRAEIVSRIGQIGLSSSPIAG